MGVVCLGSLAIINCEPTLSTYKTHTRSGYILSVGEKYRDTGDGYAGMGAQMTGNRAVKIKGVRALRDR